MPTPLLYPRPFPLASIAALCLALGCSPPPKPAPKPPQGASTPKADVGPAKPCPATPAAIPFEVKGSTHVLIADFSGRPLPNGPGYNEPNVSHTLLRATLREFRNYRAEITKLPPQLQVDFPERLLEMKRLPCSVQDEAQALAIAKQMNAHMLLWGESFCTLDLLTRPELDAGAYIICPKMIFPPPLRDEFKTAGEFLSPWELGEMKLPAEQDTRPQGIARILLGMHMYFQGHKEFASGFVEHGYTYEEPGGWGEYGVELLTALVEAQNQHWSRAFQALSPLPGERYGTESLASGAIKHLLGISRYRELNQSPNSFRSLSGKKSAARLGETLTYLGAGLGIREKILGENHPYLATDHAQIGMVLQASGDAMKAVDSYDKARRLLEALPAKDEMAIAKALVRLGAAQIDANLPKEAQATLGRADTMINGKGEPLESARVQNELGLALAAGARYPEAREHFKKAMEIVVGAQGKADPDAGVAEGNWAMVAAVQSGWIPKHKRPVLGEGKRYGGVVLRCLEGTCGGLLPGDWIRSYQEIQMVDGVDVSDLMKSATPDRKVKISLVRDGKALTLSMRGQDIVKEEKTSGGWTQNKPLVEVE